ncbi:hypothetical protein WICMUC_005577 [Wickerhamomyces mucosus]|uniref:histidine kinase n=1 Tax=Wickerhamomyces mucosus TaxID=1378264 RepID=A0A9P8P697_9ASCO|nr:hypothetical protein WICMUC_005577 [Wickerhamomyces mucosus]
MKASQIEQNLNILYYQAYWLASRDSIQSSLVTYRAGNTSVSNFQEAGETIRQFLQSTSTYVGSRLYDTHFNTVFTSYQNWSSSYVPSETINQLYPLDYNLSRIVQSHLNNHGILTGPIANITGYVMSMTLPIFTTTSSILYSSSDLVGYMTVVLSASSIQAIVEDETALDDAVVRIMATNVTDKSVTTNTSYNYILYSNPDYDYKTFKIKTSSIATEALVNNQSGYSLKTKDELNDSIAAGFCSVDFSLTRWAAVVEQSRSKFMEPQDRLTKITVISCCAIAAFIVIITFPLAHWAVQPVLRLQKATELIVQGRGLQKNNHKNGSNGGNFSDMNSHLTGSERQSMASVLSDNSPALTENGSVTTGVNRWSNSLSYVPSTGSSPNHYHSTYISNARVPEYSRIFHDELSKLTETFNAMTDELDIQYSQLEDRVKARTKQLETAKIQAESANEAKTVFIANISHELRTPLNGILGMTAIAMAENDHNKIQQSLKLIFRSGELLLHILTELLTFSKNSLKRSKLENSDFNCLDVALQVKSIFGKLAKDQKVNLSITLKPDEIRKMVLFGDSNRIIQVVMNLVSNSLKFTPVDGHVTVVISKLGEYDEAKSKEFDYKQVFVKENEHDEEKVSILQGNSSELHYDDPVLSSDPSPTISDEFDDQKSIVTVSTSSYDENFFQNQFKQSTNEKNVPDAESTNSDDKHSTKSLDEPKVWVFEFVVEDTGPGIDPKLQQSVFDPFVQGDQTLSRQYGGTGLGLSICRQLATMMNGVMELHSTVGVGSKFIFRVPLLQTKEVVNVDQSFYDDEFNMNSRRNRKVKIIEPGEIEQSEVVGEDEEDQRVDEKLDSDINNSTFSEESHTPSPIKEFGQDTEISFSGPKTGNGTGNNTPIIEEETDSYFDRRILQSTGTANKANSIYSVQSAATPGTTLGTVPESTTSNSTGDYFSSKSDDSEKELKILVAEDNIVNQEVIKRMLSLEGLKNISMAANGEEAIDYIKQSLDHTLTVEPVQYDIIFMDVQMPKIDGLQATKLIKELGFKKPIVALTAFADESNVKECVDAGMIGFLSKPIRRSQLKKILREFCPEHFKSQNPEGNNVSSN